MAMLKGLRIMIDTLTKKMDFVQINIQGRRNWGCTGYMCTPNFLGDRSKKSVKICF